MSFICQQCKKQCNNQKSFQFPVSYRDVDYTHERKNYETGETTVQVSQGKEIVKEIKVCESCVLELSSTTLAR